MEGYYSWKLLINLLKEKTRLPVIIQASIYHPANIILFWLKFFSIIQGGIFGVCFFFPLISESIDCLKGISKKLLP